MSGYPFLLNSLLHYVKREGFGSLARIPILRRQFLDCETRGNATLSMALVFCIVNMQ